MKKSALTRTELLIVLTITAFLSCLLVPALARTLQQSRFVKCMSNMRTLGRATLIYTADHDGHYPLLATRRDDDQSNIGGGTSENQPVAPWWDARIMPYIYTDAKDRYIASDHLAIQHNSYLILALFFDANMFDIFYCPCLLDDPNYAEDINNVTHMVNLTRYPNPYPKSYCMNAFLTGHTDFDSPWSYWDQQSLNDNPDARAYVVTMKASSVIDPDKTFLVMGNGTVVSYNDGGRVRAWSDFRPAHDIEYIGEPDFVYTWGASSSRIGKSNVFMADGHIETIVRPYTQDTWDNPPGLVDNYKFYAGDKYSNDGY